MKRAARRMQAKASRMVFMAGGKQRNEAAVGGKRLDVAVVEAVAHVVLHSVTRVSEKAGNALDGVTLGTLMAWGHMDPLGLRSCQLQGGREGGRR
jgi:hypothetical protein